MKQLRVLIVEDSGNDALLLVRQLKRDGYEPATHRVETAEAMRAALQGKIWDIVISDYVLPQFSGLEALKMLKESGLDLPFIITSGQIGEDMAVAAMKAGAHDYVMKNNLKRLGPAIDRELAEAEMRRERRLAEEELAEYREHLEDLVQERTEELAQLNVKLREDIAERERVEQERALLLRQVNESRLLLERVLQQMPCLVVIAEAPSGKMIYGNQTAEQIWRQRPILCPDVDHYQQWKGFHRDGRPYESREWPLARSVIAGEVVIDEQVDILRGDGTRATVSLSSAPIRNSQGHIFVGVATAIDMTERKKLDELKDEFIGMVSHELRSPLTVITGGLNTILTEGSRLSDEDKRQLLMDAVFEADALSRLLNNLLELSRAQAGRLMLNRQPTVVEEVVLEIVNRVQRESPTHRFKVCIPKGIPIIECDRLRVERILSNLVGNAVKYSPGGGTIDVFAEIRDEYLVVGVKDEGIGISEADQRKLFRPFERLETDGMRHVKGIGLGLLVCQRLVEAHSGKVWLQSQLDCGSTFFFSLPLHDMSHSDSADAS